jgi:hypothetical protein
MAEYKTLEISDIDPEKVKNLFKDFYKKYSKEEVKQMTLERLSGHSGIFHDQKYSDVLEHGFMYFAYGILFNSVPYNLLDS